MFTGIVRSLGTVHQRQDGVGGCRLQVRDASVAAAVPLGESVAVNGVCLTVVRIENVIMHFDVGPETLRATTLGQLQPGDRVNLEPALQLSDRLGGHIVTGHVDTVGVIDAAERQGEWVTMRFRYPAAFGTLLVPKGSIAVDGVSLTVVQTGEGWFEVMLIPHTLECTTLGYKSPGDTVNLEFDILAKHIRHLAEHYWPQLRSRHDVG